ncbi:tubulin-tyrosine ligase [Aulographum hederae CBS 113979]|uniref:Tubulin-tyrosine ligase n=1 Tax=Aulographum hederae CBS 113979 TaxID=1176131 RepID=A0A6G1GN55_9PEZI|nr:tubulin-tyrosine ligase [Aulographum hederae CBS 113979]
MASPTNPPQPFYALINYEDPYVQPLILSALSALLPPDSYTLITSLSDYPTTTSPPLLHFLPYESLDWTLALSNPTTHLLNAYVIRKALIRKHYLSTTVANWLVKHPTSVLRGHVKTGVELEVDYVEFLDEALVEAWEVWESWGRNAQRGEEGRREWEWWVLKPGMSDRGQGIRLFCDEEGLRGIFEGWEEEEEEEDDEDEDTTSNPDEAREGPPTDADSEEPKTKGDGIITSQLRHFILQPYIHPPLLFPPSSSTSAPPPQNTKFHIRTYILAVGALRVYVYKPMLALFAAEPYSAPWEGEVNEKLGAHLTNTCLQDGEREGVVRGFWELPEDIHLQSSNSADQNPESDSAPASVVTMEDWKENVFTQITSTTAEVFEAAARAMSIHFQLLPNAFELFGLDFLVDASGRAWLLEVNAFPDFKQTGDDLKEIVGGLFEEVVRVGVAPFFGFGGEGGGTEGTERMVRVLDIDLGRR